MVELQILNKILKDKNTSLLDLNDITRDYFNQYQEEYDYIMEHKQEYGNVPDLETFIAKFQDFDVVNVSESTEYLVNTFREEYLYSQSVPVLTKMAELLQTDAYSAVDYLKAKLPELKIDGAVKGTDIISQAKERLEEWKETKENQDTQFPRYPVPKRFGQRTSVPLRERSNRPILPKDGQTPYQRKELPLSFQ